MIHSTTQDLEDHLEEINAKLERLVPQDNRSQVVSSTVERIRNERDSTEICLQICAVVQARIDEMRFQPVPGSSPFQEMSCQDLTQATAMTMSTLRQCRDIISDNVAYLRRHQEENKKRLEYGAVTLSLPLDDEIQSLRGELDSTRECLAICNGASQRATEGVHVLEDMSTGHDGQQVFVSTLGDLFNVKGATTGDRGIQFVGTVSEASLQEFFRSQTRNSTL